MFVDGKVNIYKFVYAVSMFLFVQVLSEPGSGLHLLSKSLMSPRGSITPSKLLVPIKKEDIDLSFLPQFPSDVTVASTRSPSPDLDSQLQGSWTHRHIITVDQFTRGQVFVTLTVPINMQLCLYTRKKAKKLMKTQ